MKRLTQNLFLSALVISFLIHVGTGLVVYLKHLPSQSQDKTVEFTIVEKEKPKTTTALDMSKELAKQIVDQGEKRINDEKDAKAKFLSRFDQKVVDETKASNTGRFQNDAKQGLAPKNLEKIQPPQEKKKLAKNTPQLKKEAIIPEPDGEKALPKLADLKPQFHWDKTPPGVLNPGPQSQSDDFLKDMKTGPQTLLSTREFVYYTYYSRIKDRLRVYWEPKIKEKVTKIFTSGRHIASDEERITKLIITLDSKGKLVKVQVIGTAGIEDLDDAAIEAFQSAAPFPNPPKGIVDADGTIKIRWDFVLEAHSDLLLFQPSGLALN
jgi:TonB family protein